VIRSWRDRWLRFVLGMATGALLTGGLRDHALYWWAAIAAMAGLFAADETDGESIWRLRNWLRRHFGDYARRERAALPDGTRVRLTCKCSRFERHDGVWITSWTPRRNKNMDDPDDYLLTREGDGATTYATREVIEPVR
jgi:hypothetical protein